MKVVGLVISPCDSRSYLTVTTHIANDELFLRPFLCDVRPFCVFSFLALVEIGRSQPGWLVRRTGIPTCSQQSLNRDHRGNYHTIAVPLRVRFVSTKSIKQAANLRNQVIARLSAKSLTTITTNHQSFKHATSFDALRNLGRPSDSQYGGNQGCLSQIIQRNASRRGGDHGQHGSFQGNFTRREHFDQQDEKAGL